MECDVVYECVAVGSGPWRLGDRVGWRHTHRARPILIRPAGSDQGYALPPSWIPILMQDVYARCFRRVRYSHRCLAAHRRGLDQVLLRQRGPRPRLRVG